MDGGTTSYFDMNRNSETPNHFRGVCVCVCVCACGLIICGSLYITSHLSSLSRTMGLAMPLMVLKMKQSLKKVMVDYNVHNDSVTFTIFGFYKDSFILQWYFIW